ncbi:MAG: hypothetical protein ABSE43_04980 [Steroidobacteraceae bacterium]|jgi:hypothetical protein
MRMGWNKWCLGALAAGVVLMPVSFAAAPAPVVPEERYLGVDIDDSQQLHILSSDHRDIVPKMKKDQVGFQSAAISTDQYTVGWVALYMDQPNEDPIGRELLVFRDGKIVRTFTGNGLPILTWSFEDDGKQVAIFQNAVRGKFGPHYELRDVRTGKRIAKYDENPGRDAPQWVLDVAN